MVRRKSARSDKSRAAGSRRSFSREFKIEAVRLLTEGGRRGADVARELGIRAELLYAWRAQYRAEAEQAFPGKGHLSPEQEELARLRRENARLKEERDILKKAARYFAQQSA
jgi:transposase